MKRQTRIFPRLSAVLVLVLIAAMALTMTACKTDSAASDPTETSAEVQTTQLGQGATAFTLQVVDKDGKQTDFSIKTDKTTVGEALLELELIAGEEGAYGLYVKTVTGITADYEVDGTYWSFYINGEYATSGVDTTQVEAGAVYALKVEK